MENDQEKLSKNSIGMVGTYQVAAELSRLGLIATVTSRNAQGADILAASADGLHSVCIQVKTSSKANKAWQMGAKNEDLKSDNLYYVLVDLKVKGGRPDFYIVPSSYVADWLRADHAHWLSGTKRDGSARKDSNRRLFKIRGADEVERYRERWDLLVLR